VKPLTVGMMCECMRVPGNETCAILKGPQVHPVSGLGFIWRYSLGTVVVGWVANAPLSFSCDCE
jgi:hypothetical protein